MPELRLYTDAHIPGSVVRQLRQRGGDVVRCEDVGMKDVDDLAHLEYATGEQRAIVTGDDDFLTLDARWREEERLHCGIFFVRSEVLQKPKASIGIIVNFLWFYCEVIRAGAATLEQDVYNQVMYIRRE